MRCLLWDPGPWPADNLPTSTFTIWVAVNAVISFDCFLMATLPALVQPGGYFYDIHILNVCISVF